MVKGTKKKVVARKPKTTLQEITAIPVVEQIDGRNDNTQKKTIDDILGRSNKRPYRQTDVEEYKVYLKSLNTTDMHVHAHRLGLVPVSDRSILERRLISLFKKEAVKFTADRTANLPEPKLSDRAKQILNRGR